MKVSFEIAFLIYRKLNVDSRQGNGARNEYISRQEIIGEFESNIERLKESIKNSEEGSNNRDREKRLELKKETLEEVKQIDDWQEFHRKIASGDFSIGESRKKVKSYGISCK